MASFVAAAVGLAVGVALVAAGVASAAGLLAGAALAAVAAVAFTRSRPHARADLVLAALAPLALYVALLLAAVFVAVVWPRGTEQRSAPLVERVRPAGGGAAALRG